MGNIVKVDLSRQSGANFDGMERLKMDKYVCTACGYVYDPAVGDPDGGIAPGTPFESIPEDWVCPICGVGKDMFERE